MISVGAASNRCDLTYFEREIRLRGRNLTPKPFLNLPMKKIEPLTANPEIMCLETQTSTQHRQYCCTWEPPESVDMACKSRY